MSAPVAVISCVHGNLAALEAVLADIDRRGIRQLVCLGDLVGYGPEPNEVVERIATRRIKTIRGCWDEGIGQASGTCGCAYDDPGEAALGKLAYDWTQAEVTAATRDFLRELPFGVDAPSAHGRVLFVHGSPRSTSEYLLESVHDLILLERAAAAGCDVLVCGHTHVPYARWVDGTLRATTVASTTAPAGAGWEVPLAPKLILNAGSVGEPRHGRPRSTYVTLDLDTLGFAIHEVAYDLDRTLARLAAKGLPPAFGERLVHGRELAAKSKAIACAC